MDQTLITMRQIPCHGYQTLSQKKKTLEKAQTSLQKEHRNNESTVNCLPYSLQTKSTQSRGPMKVHLLCAINVLLNLHTTSRGCQSCWLLYKDLWWWFKHLNNSNGADISIFGGFFFCFPFPSPQPYGYEYLFAKSWQNYFLCVGQCSEPGPLGFTQKHPNKDESWKLANLHSKLLWSNFKSVSSAIFLLMTTVMTLT